jgi:hypothetical protein
MLSVLISIPTFFAPQAKAVGIQENGDWCLQIVMAELVYNDSVNDYKHVVKNRGPFANESERLSHLENAYNKVSNMRARCSFQPVRMRFEIITKSDIHCK